MLLGGGRIDADLLTMLSLILLDRALYGSPALKTASARNTI
jgi:hypothetical protein